MDGVPSSAAPTSEVWEENPHFGSPWSAGAPPQGTADSSPPLGVEGAPGAHSPDLGTPQTPGAPLSSPHPHPTTSAHVAMAHPPGACAGPWNPGVLSSNLTTSWD